MKDKLTKYPVGIQSFEKIISGGYLYVDKTALIHELVETAPFVFLSRPRRFGKSLLVSTLQAYFEGRRELFEGLAIASMEKDWEAYPVIRIDFAGSNFEEPGKLQNHLELTLSRYEQLYGSDPNEKDLPGRFSGLILRAAQQTGRKVVVLVDEYDKPLLDCIDSGNLHERHRRELQGFYGVLKAYDEHIRFALLTGVGKFGHVSVFSGLNNLTDISLIPKYNAICGISESEFRGGFAEPVASFARENGMEEAEVWKEFKENYDGYLFARKGEGIYNPFSVLNALSTGEIKPYWFRSGTPSMLVKILKNSDLPVFEIDGAQLTEEQLSDITDPRRNYPALLYQSGYLTIRGYDADYGRYRLGFPNREVSSGFWNSLYDQYIAPAPGNSDFDIYRFIDDVRAGNAEGFMRRLQSLVASMSPGVERHLEVHFQNILEIVFKMLSLKVKTEVNVARGRCDMVVETSDCVFVMEFKTDESPEVAIRQIREKGYALPYAGGSRRVVLIGAGFSTSAKTLESFVIEPL